LVRRKEVQKIACRQDGEQGADRLLIPEEQEQRINAE